MGVVTVGLTEPTVVATHSWLDDAHAVVDFAARENFEKNMAGGMAGLKAGTTNEWTAIDRPALVVICRTIIVLGSSRALRSPQMPFNRFAHERADVLFVHKCSRDPTPTRARSAAAPRGPQALIPDPLYQRYRRSRHRPARLSCRWHRSLRGPQARSRLFRARPRRRHPPQGARVHAACLRVSAAARTTAWRLRACGFFSWRRGYR